MPKERKKERKRKHSEVDDVEIKKHYDTFYEQAPPGTVQKEVERPEDSIPNMPGNKAARDFLASAPSKGLWMPLGKEVKVMKCWRCKSYGHRTGDRECPMFISGNRDNERFRTAHEDPMHDFVVESKRQEKQTRIDQLKALLAESTTSEDSSSSKESDDSIKKCKRKKCKSDKHKKKSKEKKKEKYKNEISSSEESDHNHHRHYKHKHGKDSDEISDSDESHSTMNKGHNYSKSKLRKHRDRSRDKGREHSKHRHKKNL